MLVMSTNGQNYAQASIFYVELEIEEKPKRQDLQNLPRAHPREHVHTYGGAWDQISQSRPDRPNSATSTSFISVYIQTVTPPDTRRNNKRKVSLSEGNSYVTSPTLPKHNRIK
jgi:hypothetical protein